nr:MAG TPA: hypothetical protein [Bacteriophage sp.]
MFHFVSISVLFSHQIRLKSSGSTLSWLSA